MVETKNRAKMNEWILDFDSSSGEKHSSKQMLIVTTADNCKCLLESLLYKLGNNLFLLPQVAKKK